MDPCIGFLGPREERDITINFTAHALMEYTDVRVPCIVDGMDDTVYLQLAADTKGLNVDYLALDLDGK